MKAKISRGKGFKGALDYCLDEQKGAQVVGGNMSSDSAAELSSEFKLSRTLRPDCKKPVWHCSLSLPQGERLSDEKWQEVTNDYMQKMGLDPANHQFVAVRHADTDHDHIHIVASRIGLDSKLWHGQHDVRKAINACQELEQAHGLQLTPGLEMNENHRSSLKRGEIEMSLKTGEAPPKLVLQQAIDEALKDKPDTSAFIERLEAAGINVKPNIASTGRMNGFSVEYQDVAFKASQLGKSYSWAQLQKRGLDYDQERDADVLRAAKERSEQSQEDLSSPDNAPTPNQQYKRTVDYMQEFKPGCWRFESGKRVVVQELESGGMWCAKTDTAAKAALQLALDKGWSTITVKTEDAQHAERLYRAALKVGYPPHVITLAHDQLTPEQINEINKEFGYEQDRASQSNSSAAQQGNLSADQRAAALTRAERRELSAADRAFSSSAGSAERGRQADNNKERELLDEKAQAVEGSAGRTDERANKRATALEPAQQQLAAVDKPDKQEAAASVAQSLDSSDQYRHADSAGAVDRVHSLAAAAVVSREGSGPVLQRDQRSRSAAHTADRQRQQPVAAHIKAKQHAWRQQHEALQAPAYRITLTARREELKTYNHGKNKGPDGAEKFYTAQEVQELIPQLSRQNARGYDIYLTPISDQHHYIVLDDTDQQRLEQMHQRTGITPALIQESSPGNLQAIICAEKVPGKHEQSNANYIVQGLNKAYGDPQFTGVVHPFRLAGFMNQKPKYEQQNRRPIVRPRPILQCRPGADPVLNQMLDKQRQQQQEQQQRQRVQERTQRIESFNEHNKSGVDERYRELAQQYCKYVDSKGWERDWSRIDYAIAGEMLKQDYYSENQIADAIKDNSPGIDERKQNPSYYAQQTVAKAAQSPEVQQHRERQQEPEMEM
jgi:hypothetical protein